MADQFHPAGKMIEYT